MYLLKIVKATLWLCNPTYHLTAPYFISNFKLMGGGGRNRERHSNPILIDADMQKTPPYPQLSV